MQDYGLRTSQLLASAPLRWCQRFMGTAAPSLLNPRVDTLKTAIGSQLIPSNTAADCVNLGMRAGRKPSWQSLTALAVMTVGAACHSSAPYGDSQQQGYGFKDVLKMGLCGVGFVSGLNAEKAPPSSPSPLVDGGQLWNAFYRSLQEGLTDDQKEKLRLLVVSCTPQEIHRLAKTMALLNQRFVEAKENHQLPVYELLRDRLTFSSVAKLRLGIQDLHALYPYRAAVMRCVTPDLLERPLAYAPCRDTLKQARASSAWQESLEVRAGVSGTIVRSDNSLAYKNWKKAGALMATAAEDRRPVTKELLDSIQQTLCLDLPRERPNLGNCCYPDLDPDGLRAPGKYYIHSKYVEREMTAFLTWLEAQLEKFDGGVETSQIILTATQAAQWLTSIHPFPEGNGRVSRLLMDYILQRYGIFPPMLGERIASVFDHTQQSADGNRTFELVAEGVYKSYINFGKKVFRT